MEMQEFELLYWSYFMSLFFYFSPLMLTRHVLIEKIIIIKEEKGKESLNNMQLTKKKCASYAIDCDSMNPIVYKVQTYTGKIPYTNIVIDIRPKPFCDNHRVRTSSSGKVSMAIYKECAMKKVSANAQKK